MYESRTSNLITYYSSKSTFIKEIWNEFTKPPHENIFFRNLDYLFRKSDLVEFNNDKWIMKPHVFCNDYYDEQDIFPVILLINDIGSIFEFNPDSFINKKILAPPFDEIENTFNLQTL
jgi:hypothetical protein